MNSTQPFETMTPIEAIDAFFLGVVRWKTWVVASRDTTQTSLTIALTKSAGAFHDSSLYQDDRGRVWRSSFRWVEVGDNPFHHTENVLQEMVRSDPGDPYSKYVVDRELVIFRGYTGDGSVQVVETGEGPITLAKRSWGENMAEDWGWTCPNPHGAVGTALYYRTTLDTMLRGMAVADCILAHRDVPDCGRILCFTHMVLDKMAGCYGIRCYMY
jgi:hypothetical protein